MSLTQNQLDSIRHAQDRGCIIRILAQEFGAEMTSVGTIRSGLDLLGFPVSQAAFAAHIKYLQGQGYIDVWRNKDMPGYRIDRPNCGDPNEIRFARLSPKGLQLHDGLIAEDPSVRFA